MNERKNKALKLQGKCEYTIYFGGALSHKNQKQQKFGDINWCTHNQIIQGNLIRKNQKREICRKHRTSLTNLGI